MKRSLRDKWVAALRSGDYQQTRGMLHRRDKDCKTERDVQGYCCLGVLQDIVDGDVERGSSGVAHGFPSLEFLNRVGLEHGDMYKLADLNDISRKDFAHIATEITFMIPVEEDDEG